MHTRLTLPLCVVGLVTAGVVASTNVLAMTPPSEADAPVTSVAVGLAQVGNKGTLESTIKLPACSASWVRLPSQKGNDPALMLTNGHCMVGGMPAQGVVYVNRPMKMSGDLLDKAGKALLKVESSTVLYGTMTDTDAALLQLTLTHDEITSKTGGLQPLTIAAQAAAVGEAITVPSSYWRQVYTCTVDKRVFELLEGPYVWKDSLRYASSPECQTKGGTSGSPIVSVTTGEVVGINNTGHDGMKDCQMNAPCERDVPNGPTQGLKGRKYGQRIDRLLGCLNEAGGIDLTRPGCELAKPKG